jgi:hypothetical protein
MTALLGLLGWWFYSFFRPQAGEMANNPVAALLQQHPGHPAPQQAVRALRQVTLPPGPPLQTLGNPQGRVTLTLLLDPASVASRRQLFAWLNLSLPNTRVELRYAPTRNSLAGGVVLQLAQRFGKAPQLWKALYAETEDLTDTALLQLLADQGVRLEEIRSALSNPNSPLLRNAQAAAAWAQQYGLKPPRALIDTLLLEDNALATALLPVYIQRRLANAPLTQADDYLLMRK